ncbi:hypothetical protein CHS0354_026775 [Potamilus streckersoni]|uniref:Ribosomal protein n=1 Tax=Potamilus streckersoni TaxID=2493646 RepID=A0AAE0T522_9BIVA|nr:hypothetical protein CHS0354_026775 [Potamilus streckersoni]
MKQTKRHKLFSEKVENTMLYTLEEGIKKLKECKKSKFDENVDIVIKLGIDPKKTDQAIRGACNLPHGTGKTVRVLVFAKGDKEREAKEAGADFVGGADLSEKIKGGWLEFDRVIATPDMMGEVGKIGKILGPRNLMPNPKTGGVTADVARAVGDLKKGQAQFKSDKGANVHVPVGKLSFEEGKLKDNIMSVVDTVNRLKPSASKGIYLKGMVISSTMGPGIKINISGIAEALRRQYHEIFSQASSCILIETHKLTVAEVTEIRKLLSKENCGFKVLKNRIAVKAAAGTPFEQAVPHLTKTRALIYSAKDVVAPSKIMSKQVKQNNKMSLVFGTLVSGDRVQTLTPADINALGNLPSKEELIAKVLYVLNAPITNFVRTINEVPASFARVLQATADSRQSAA